MENQVQHRKIDQPLTTRADIRRQSPTTIAQYASSCIDSIRQTQIGLLTYCRLPRLRNPTWPTISTIKQLSTMKTDYPESKDHISYIAKMRKGKKKVGRTYPKQRRSGKYCRCSTIPRAPELNNQY